MPKNAKELLEQAVKDAKSIGAREIAVRLGKRLPMTMPILEILKATLDEYLKEIGETI